MQVSVLRTKIHRAMVTEASLDYEGSLGIDEEFMRMVGLLPNERILVGNIANGARFETYAITEPAGSKAIVLNGAVAHLGKIGDLLVIMSFASMTAEEAKLWQPKRLTLGRENQEIIKLIN